MKKWCGVLLLSVAFSGCMKDNLVRPRASGLEAGGSVQLPKPRLPFVPTLVMDQCMNSYDELVALLGGAEVNITLVILEDGTRISTGGNVLSMIYRVELSNQSFSLCRSIFDVTHSVGAEVQHIWWNVWTRGCHISQPGDPPYTNLQLNGETILVNTNFTWGLSPHVGKRISYLVVG